MTKLRDDGFMETDDPVVAACFLDKEFPDGSMVVGLDIEGVQWFDENTQTFSNHAFPILIPAKTVAEVIADAVHGSLTWFVIVATIPVADGTMAGGDWVLKTWTRTHTKEGT